MGKFGSYTDGSPAEAADFLLVKRGSSTLRVSAESIADLSDAEVEAVEAALEAHIAATTDAHDASAVAFAPVGTIAGTDVQSAVAEVATDATAAAAAAQAFAIQRANHTGDQAISTVTGLQTALDKRSRLVARTETAVTVVNSTAETSLCSLATPTVGVGDRLILRAGGDLINNSAGSVNFTFRLKLGGTTLCTSNALAIAVSPNRRRWNIEAVFAVAVVASSQLVSGQLVVGNASATTMFLSTSTNVGALGGTSAEDLSTAKNVVFSVEMSAADPLAELVLRQASLELLPAP